MPYYLDENALGKIATAINGKQNKYTEITWADLKALRDAGQLVPGTQYRITDYACTTSADDTSSAGHSFDIIVVADSANKLNENARACLHDGDTYFANCKLEAWQLKYCLDNDMSRFDWALIPHDGYVKTSSSRYYRASEYDDIGGRGYAFMKAGGNPPIEFTEFLFTTTLNSPTRGHSYYISNGQWYDYWVDYNLTYYSPSSLSGTGVIYQMIDEFGNECPYDFKNILFTRSGSYSSAYTFSITNNSAYADATINGRKTQCLGNVIKEYGSLGTRRLNFNVLISDSNNSSPNHNIFEKNCYDNFLKRGCHDNTFKESCVRNTLGTNCMNNFFGRDCTNNSIGNDCWKNTFDRECKDLSIANYSKSNYFGYECDGITIGETCLDNIFGPQSKGLTLGSDCSENSFGRGCYNIRFGTNTSNNTFGNGCSYITFGTGKSAVNYCKNNIIDNETKYLNITSSDTTASSSNYLQNIHIHLGVIGSSNTNRLAITVPDRNLAYETNYAKAGTNTVEL